MRNAAAADGVCVWADVATKFNQYNCNTLAKDFVLHAHTGSQTVTMANYVNNVKRFKFIRRPQKLAPKEPPATGAATDDGTKRSERTQA